METDIEQTSGDPGQPCDIEQAIAELIARDITVPYRISEKRRRHEKSSHLLRHWQLSTAVELAA